MPKPLQSPCALYNAGVGTNTPILLFVKLPKAVASSAGGVFFVRKICSNLARSLAANGTQMKQNAKSMYWGNKNNLSRQESGLNAASNAAWQGIYGQQAQSGNNLQEKGLNVMGSAGMEYAKSEDAPGWLEKLFSKG
jgi:hypothetical protein